MDARRESELTATKNRTTVERKSERELVVTRTFNGPARIVFEAVDQARAAQAVVGTKSTGVPLISCEADVRVGGRYPFRVRPRCLRGKRWQDAAGPARTRAVPGP